MHPLNNGSQVESVPALKPRVGTAGYFSESNDNGAPSYPGQDWFNAVIREFQGALAANGVTFDSDKFDHLQKMITNASNGVRNLFEVNQNFNVEGADGTLTSSNQTFTDGQEFSFGWFVTGGADLVDVKIVDGEVTATSGKVQRAYPKDPAGLLTAASVYGSVTAKNGTQLYADTLQTNGIEVTESASNIYLTVDFATYTDGIAVVSLSGSRGAVFPVSNPTSSHGLPVLIEKNDSTWPGGATITYDDITKFNWITLIAKVTNGGTGILGLKSIRLPTSELLSNGAATILNLTQYGTSSDRLWIAVSQVTANQLLVSSFQQGLITGGFYGLYGEY